MPKVRTLSQSSLPGRTGRAIRIAVIDSGIHMGHPHIGNVEAAVAFDDGGGRHDEAVDRLGHGTAVAAAIHEKAPEATLLIAKVFDRQLASTGAALVAGIQWAVDAGADLINLSLGTTNESHRAALENAVAHAIEQRALIVAAAPTPAEHWLPGGLKGVAAVELDWSCDRDECVLAVDDDGAIRARASGYARPIPGVPLDQNLKGLSLAVANATGLIALVFDDLSVSS